MCGIAGFASGEVQDPDSVSGALCEELARRGPDGTWVAPGAVTLVQTRLAVMDLSPRVQYPMHTEDGRLSLAYNGEIYNFAVLRRELAQAGHSFHTHCDAEVVLHG